MSKSATTLRAMRAPDFADTGEYVVRTAQGDKRIYRDRDPHVRWLLVLPYEERKGFADYSRDYLGSTKDEALRALEKMSP